ncbi:hypothetical protein ACFL35_07565 [Candidatus Riflebacteria bacterium]
MIDRIILLAAFFFLTGFLYAEDSFIQLLPDPPIRADSLFQIVIRHEFPLKSELWSIKELELLKHENFAVLHKKEKRYESFDGTTVVEDFTFFIKARESGEFNYPIFRFSYESATATFACSHAKHSEAGFFMSNQVTQPLRIEEQVKYQVGFVFPNLYNLKEQRKIQPSFSGELFIIFILLFTGYAVFNYSQKSLPLRLPTENTTSKLSEILNLEAKNLQEKLATGETIEAKDLEQYFIFSIQTITGNKKEVSKTNLTMQDLNGLPVPDSLIINTKRNLKKLHEMSLKNHHFNREEAREWISILQENLQFLLKKLP